MFFHRHILGAVFAAFAAAAPLVAQSPETTPSDGLLLLKNGRTLAGRITRDGEFYSVASPESVVQIRTAEAEAVCRNLDEAYSHRLARTDLRNVDARLDLAQWCLDHGLFGPSARELTEAYRLDDLHPRIALLERRLKAEMARPKPPEPSAAPPRSVVDDDALERAAHSIPHDALQDFTQHVQPLLVNYCAAAGCHGPRAASTFTLQRVYLNEKNDPRAVRMNLLAVLAQIDRKHPGTSRLLTVPISPHGGAKKPIFHAHNVEHYRQLATWVARTAQPTSTATRPKTVQPKAAETQGESELLQRLPIAPPDAGPTAAPMPELR